MKITNYQTHTFGVRTLAEQQIKSLPTPVSAEQARLSQELIDTEALQVAEAVREDRRARRENAATEKQIAAGALADNGQRFDKSSQQLEANELRRGSLIVALIYLACLLACQVAEFDLTWTTLPYVLNIRQNSFAGLMLGLAPTTALAILKVVIAILLWEPWQAARANLAVRGRALRSIAMSIFLVFVGLMTIYMVSVLSPAREEAAKARRNTAMMSEKTVAVDEQKITRAVDAVAIALAINGAMFFLMGMTELNRASAYWRSRLAVAYLRGRGRRLEAGYQRAAAQLVLQEENWQQVDEKARLCAEHYRKRLLLLLDQVKNRPQKLRSSREMVDEIFATSLLRQDLSSPGQATSPASRNSIV